jgi:hypothetical protein
MRNQRQFQGPPFLNMPIQPESTHPNHYSGQPNNMFNPFLMGLPQNPIEHPVNPLPIQTILDDPLYPIYNMNPYQPPSAFMQNQLLGLPNEEPPRPNSQKGLVEYFLGKDGNVDIDKMISTAGQLMGTLNQFTGLVKGVSSLFKI